MTYLEGRVEHSLANWSPRPTDSGSKWEDAIFWRMACERVAGVLTGPMRPQDFARLLRQNRISDRLTPSLISAGEDLGLWYWDGSTSRWIPGGK